MKQFIVLFICVILCTLTACSSNNNSTTNTESVTPTVTSLTNDNPPAQGVYKKVSVVDQYLDGVKPSEDLEAYKQELANDPMTSKMILNWNLGEDQATLYEKWDLSTDEQGIYVEKTYVTTWTMPEQLTPGETIAIDVTSQTTALLDGKTDENGGEGTTYFSLSAGAEKTSLTDLNSNASDILYDANGKMTHSGIVELDIPTSNTYKYITIEVCYSSGYLTLYKTYLYER